MSGETGRAPDLVGRGLVAEIVAVLEEHDPDLFEWWFPEGSNSAILRCWCGDLVTIPGGDRPDISGAHRTHLAEAIERRIRPATDGPQ